MELTLTVPGHNRAVGAFNQVLMSAINNALRLSKDVGDELQSSRLRRVLVTDLVDGNLHNAHSTNAHYIMMLNHLLENIGYCRMDSRLLTAYVHTTLLGDRAPIKYRRIGHVCGARSDEGAIYCSDNASVSQWQTWKSVSECPGCVIYHALEDVTDLLTADIYRIVAAMYANGLIDLNGTTDLSIVRYVGDVLILKDYNSHEQQLPARS